MNNPVIIGFMQTDGQFNPEADPRPENWDSNMPPVRPHIVHLQEFDTEIRLIFPGLEIWLKKADLENHVI